MLLYLFLSITVLFVSGFLFKKAAGTLSPFKPNLVSYIFFYNFIIQSAIGAFLIVSGLDFRFSFGEEVRYLGWLSVQYALLVTPLGMLLSKSLLVNKVSVKNLFERYVNSPVDIKFCGGRSLKWSVWLFSVLSIFSCLYVFYIIGYYPFFKILESSAYDLAVSRIDSAREFSGNVYIRNLFALSFTPFLSYAWFFFYKSTGRITDFIMFLVLFFMSLGILYYDFSKSPVLWYLIGFIFAGVYLDGRPRKFLLVSLFILILSLIIGLYLYAGNSVGILFAYNFGPIGRLILSQAEGLYHMLSIFPNTYDYIGIRSLSGALSNIFGYEDSEGAARITMMHVNPEAVKQGLAGVMNTLFIGEAWANFGVLGLLLGPLWVGFLIQTLYIFFIKSNKNPIFLALFVFYSVNSSLTGGFNAYIYNPQLITFVIYVTAIFFVALLLKQAIRPPTKRRG